MKNTEPDFEVRNLSEYSIEDLKNLLFAIHTGEEEIKNFKGLYPNVDKMKQSLDIWAYRIKDALSQAKKNEVTKV